MVKDSTGTDGVHWQDELVELHVLSQHGDTGAATTAQRWCAEDPLARQAWDAVEQACARVNDQPPWADKTQP
jgi:ferric-dicitrate binding protein FerR (iron transport regulator)